MHLQMPREPPVIKACFPFSDIALLLLLRGFVQPALSPSSSTSTPALQTLPQPLPKHRYRFRPSLFGMRKRPLKKRLPLRRCLRQHLPHRRGNYFPYFPLPYHPNFPPQTRAPPERLSPQYPPAPPSPPPANPAPPAPLP